MADDPECRARGVSRGGVPVCWEAGVGAEGHPGVPRKEVFGVQILLRGTMLEVFMRRGPEVRRRIGIVPCIEVACLDIRAR
jgi:hypothetical protein